MDFKTVYTEVRSEGRYHAEDHGASTYGVYFLAKRCRKPKYIATAGSMEGIKVRIQDHSRMVNGLDCYKSLMRKHAFKDADGDDLAQCQNCGMEWTTFVAKWGANAQAE